MRQRGEGIRKGGFRVQGSLGLQEVNEVQAEETKATSAWFIYKLDTTYESPRSTYPRTTILGVSQILVQGS